MSTDEARRRAEQSLSNLHVPLGKVSTSSVNVLTILLDLSERDSIADAMKAKDSINEIARSISELPISSDTFIAVYALNKGVLREFTPAEEFLPLTEDEMTCKVALSPLYHGIDLCVDQCTMNRMSLELCGFEVIAALVCFAGSRTHDARFDEFFGSTSLSSLREKLQSFLPKYGRSRLAGIGIGEHAAAEFARYGFPADTIHPITNATQAATEFFVTFS